MPTPPQAMFAADIRLASDDDAVVVAEALGELQPLEGRID